MFFWLKCYWERSEKMNKQIIGLTSYTSWCILQDLNDLFIAKIEKKKFFIILFNCHIFFVNNWVLLKNYSKKNSLDWCMQSLFSLHEICCFLHYAHFFSNFFIIVIIVIRLFALFDRFELNAQSFSLTLSVGYY